MKMSFFFYDCGEYLLATNINVIIYSYAIVLARLNLCFETRHYYTYYARVIILCTIYARGVLFTRRVKRHVLCYFLLSHIFLDLSRIPHDIIMSDTLPPSQRHRYALVVRRLIRSTPAPGKKAIFSHACSKNATVIQDEFAVQWPPLSMFRTQLRASTTV